MLEKLKNISPQLFFVIAAVLCSVVFNIVTPPLQANDEFNHFYRAYQIAEGDLLPHKVDNRLGGEIPNCINKFVFPFDIAATEMRLTVTKQDVLDGFKIKYAKDTAAFKDFPNTSYYSPISYLPHAIAIFLAKKLNCSVGTMYYAGRFLTCFVWILCIFFVIKIVPVYKWLFAAINLLPMNIWLANSFSADTVSNLLAMLFIALILKHTFSGNSFRPKDLVPLIVLIALLALAKVVYVAVVLSFLIIPIAKFKTRSQFFLFSSIVLLSGFLTAAYWSGEVMSKYTPYATYNPEFREWICLTHYSNYYEQKAYILSHGTYFFKVIYHSIFDHPHTFLRGYIGMYGNSDIWMPGWLTCLAYAAIIFIVLFERNNFRFNPLQRVILFGASFASFVLLLLSQHLTWDAVGEGVVDAVQGRYLIPIFPFLFFAMGNYKLKIKVNYLAILVPLFLILYTVSAYDIRHRYYVGNCIEEKGFTCNAEKVNKEGVFLTSDTAIFLQGGALKTDSISYSQKSCAKLPSQGFVFTYKFTRAQYGDVLEFSMLEKGNSAVLVTESVGTKCNKIYEPHSGISYYDKNGWGRLYARFSIPKKYDCDTFLFYIWNPGKTTAYLDDLRFTSYKFEK